jgi:hypothetical protein
MDIESSTIIEQPHSSDDHEHGPIQEIIDKLDTTLNSLKNQQSECLMGKETSLSHEKSIILSLKCEGCSIPALSDFKTTKDPNGQVHVELKLNFE